MVQIYLAAINVIILGMLGSIIGTSVRETCHSRIGEINSHACDSTKLNLPFKQVGVVSVLKEGKLKTEDRDRLIQKKNATHTNCRCFDNDHMGKHQIYKRNLNRDYPVENLIRDYTIGNSNRDDTVGNLNKNFEIKNTKRASEPEKFDNKGLIDDALIIDSSDGFIKGNNFDEAVDQEVDFINLSINGTEKTNDTTRVAPNEIPSIVGEDYEIDFVKRQSDSDIPKELDRQDVMRKKREESSNEKTFSQDKNNGLKEEIDRVYQDLSQNVRLLSELRDKESRLLKKPVKKRFIIIDDPTMSVADFMRKRRCDPEVTVEMDTSKDASPDRLEHVERKIEEEVLQVNVPLKCSASINAHT